MDNIVFRGEIIHESQIKLWFLRLIVNRRVFIGEYCIVNPPLIVSEKLHPYLNWRCTSKGLKGAQG